MNKLLVVITGLALFTLCGVCDAGESKAVNSSQALGNVLLDGKPEVQFDKLVFSVKPQYMLSNSAHDGTYGAEVSLGYYFSKYCGAQLSLGYIDTDSVIQNYSVDIIAKYPYENFFLNGNDVVKFEPYALLGQGLHDNLVNGWLTRLGLGVNLEVIPLNGTVLFVEGIYNLVANDVVDYTTVGVGVRISF